MKQNFMMKKSYVAPQVVALKVASEGEVFASSIPGDTGFYTQQGVSTSTLGTSSSTTSGSVFNLRSTSSTLKSEQSANEIYDEIMSFD